MFLPVFRQITVRGTTFSTFYALVFFTTDIRMALWLIFFTVYLSVSLQMVLPPEPFVTRRTQIWPWLVVA